MNYYNDNDPKACAWLRELIAQGHLPPGTVDERSILEIKPDDLAGFDQCHFFAGVGFWSLALQWAGLGTTTGIWTGSCPCQPFSCAGAGKGTADERHLWPVFRELIVACRPRVVFGEQVASAAVVGKVGRCAAPPSVPVWLDGVRADLEAAGYAFGAAVLGAHSVGAPHIRQRLYWVADAWTRDTEKHGRKVRRNVHGELHWEGLGEGLRTCGTPDMPGERCGEEGADGDRSAQRIGEFGATRRTPDSECHTGEPGRVADVPGERDKTASGRPHVKPRRFGATGRAPIPACRGLGADGRAPGPSGHAELVQQVGRAPDMQLKGLERHAGDGADRYESRRHDAESVGHAAQGVGAGGPRDAEGDDEQRDRQSGSGVRRQEPIGGSMPWSDYRIHRYLDGKDRRIPSEPRLFPLADDRHPYHRGRVGLLRGAGNGIVPQVAAEFVRAWMDCSANK